MDLVRPPRKEYDCLMAVNSRGGRKPWALVSVHLSGPHLRNEMLLYVMILSCAKGIMENMTAVMLGTLLLGNANIKQKRKN